MGRVSALSYKQSVFNVVVPLRRARALLFNSVTEQIALVEQSELDDLNSVGEVGSVSDPTYRHKLLKAGGFILPTEVDERRQISDRFDRKKNARDSLRITIASTLQCNLACGYCFQGLNKPSGKLTDDAQKAFISYIERRAPELNHLGVVWYGGEPLMNQPEIWRTASNLLEIVDEHGINYSSSIITNGFLLTSELARQLVLHGVSDAQVTLDGMSESHDRNRPHVSGRGSFDRIRKNIESVLDQSKLRIVVRLSIDEHNVDDIRTLLFYLHDEGFASKSHFSVYFAPIEAISEKCGDYESETLSKVEYANAETTLMELAYELGLLRLSSFGQDRSLCQAVKPNDFVLNPDGSLHKCWDTVTIDGLRSANIIDQNFEKAVSDNEWTSWKPNNPVCSACKISPICGGGCAFKTVHSTQQAGETASLPCIPLKFNLAEQIFLRAKIAGIVSEEDWDDELSPTLPRSGLQKTGRPHDMRTREAFV